MSRQHTLARTVECTGVGLHTGAPVRLALSPADPDAGVAFHRLDVKGRDARIPADALSVSTTQLGTNLTNAAGVTVATVEHFLAACSGLGLDNVDVAIDGPELPILDGSSAPFCALIASAGLVEQGAARRRLHMLKTVEVRDGSKLARLSPGDGLEIRIAIDFPSRAIGRQTFSWRHRPGGFQSDVAWARTFGFVQEVEKLRAMGLARGGSMDNAIVVDGDAILNPDGLQAPDEFVRHKLLDVIGDLFLAGGAIDGLYEGEQPGHALNNRLLRAVFADPDSFEWRNDDR